jgi:hypothetical protein
MDWTQIISSDYIIYLAFFCIILLLILWNGILSVQLSKLKSRYKRFMRGSTNKSIEQLIQEYMESIDNTVGKVDVLSEDLIHLKDQVDRCIQKCHMIRYNAFSDTGSDLSYSIALLDSYNNGIIISSIYGRNESVTYAKPVDNGQCKYPLSLEEELVLSRCIKVTL